MGSTPEISDSKKPPGTSANTGAYTCTYRGCTVRVGTPGKLQEHKLQAHQDSAAEGGHHKCERLNPSTRTPCNIVFSRSYDLTRHENTIHNSKRQKIRCPHCNSTRKTFSRKDALTRHVRMEHPEHVNQSKREKTFS